MDVANVNKVQLCEMYEIELVLRVLGASPRVVLDESVANSLQTAS